MPKNESGAQKIGNSGGQKYNSDAQKIRNSGAKKVTRVKLCFTRVNCGFRESFVNASGCATNKKKNWKKLSFVYFFKFFS